MVRFPGGIVSFDHLAFRINATGGLDPGPESPIMCVGTIALICALTATGAFAALHRFAPKVRHA